MTTKIRTRAPATALTLALAVALSACTQAPTVEPAPTVTAAPTVVAPAPEPTTTDEPEPVEPVVEVEPEITPEDAALKALDGENARLQVLTDSDIGNETALTAILEAVNDAYDDGVQVIAVVPYTEPGTGKFMHWLGWVATTSGQWEAAAKATVSPTRDAAAKAARAWAKEAHGDWVVWVADVDV